MHDIEYVGFFKLDIYLQVGAKTESSRTEKRKTGKVEEVEEGRGKMKEKE